MASLSSVYLIPTVLADNITSVIPAYVVDAIKNCDVFFVENVKTTRRYFKLLWKEMVIDDYEWHVIHKAEAEVRSKFMDAIAQNKTIGIVSEAGCPCVADPGQILVDVAHQLKAKVIPLVGPSSILMSLMASGLNGQTFQFVGYLPIESVERKKKIKELELYSQKNQCTQIFIETPYRNNQLLKDIVQTCRKDTKICVAVDLTSDAESVITKTVDAWSKASVDLHKRQAIFLMLS